MHYPSVPRPSSSGRHKTAKSGVRREAWCTSRSSGRWRAREVPSSGGLGPFSRHRSVQPATRSSPKGLYNCLLMTPCLVSNLNRTGRLSPPRFQQGQDTISQTGQLVITTAPNSHNFCNYFTQEEQHPAADLLPQLGHRNYLPPQ